MTHSEKIPKEFLTREEEKKLTLLWKNNRDEKAREKIIKAYKKFVLRYAMKASRAGISLDDLVQEANMGLMSALDKFDPELGFGFSTFARHHIRSKLQIFILENVGPLRIFNTATTKGLLARYTQTLKEAQELDDPNQDIRKYICEKLEINEDQLIRFEMATSIPTSINLSSNDEDDHNKGVDLISTENPEETLSQKKDHTITHSIVEDALESLTEREKKIIVKRHLQDEKETLETLSLELGISRERVRQIEIRSLEKIKESLLKRGIRSFDDIF